jgi:NADPH:quinone reductase-like Zn-dependent oxidoreductase
MIHVVRREAQVQLLRSKGATHVLNSSSDDFMAQLRALSKQLKATAALEAVAGPMTGTIHNALPRGSTVYVYGALSVSPCGNIDPVELIFHEKKIKGFFLGAWLRDRGALRTILAARRVQAMLVDGRIETEFQRRLGFDELREGFTQYVENMTSGKVLLMPHVRV